MKLSLALKKVLLGSVLLSGFVASSAQAVVTVFEQTDTLFGTSFTGKSYAFNIPTAGDYQATLSDNSFLAPFNSLALAITKTGGGTMGSVVINPLTLSASFDFLATLTGSYTAVVIGQPNLLTPAGTFGVTVVAIPEPEVWAMMLVGFGLVVFRVRQKSRKAAALHFA